MSSLIPTNNYSNNLSNSNNFFTKNLTNDPNPGIRNLFPPNLNPHNDSWDPYNLKQYLKANKKDLSFVFTSDASKESSFISNFFNKFFASASMTTNPFYDAISNSDVNKVRELIKTNNYVKDYKNELERYIELLGMKKIDDNETSTEIIYLLTEALIENDIKKAFNFIDNKVYHRPSKSILKNAIHSFKNKTLNDEGLDSYYNIIKAITTNDYHGIHNSDINISVTNAFISAIKYGLKAKVKAMIKAGVNEKLIFLLPLVNGDIASLKDLDKNAISDPYLLSCDSDCWDAISIMSLAKEDKYHNQEIKVPNELIYELSKMAHDRQSLLTWAISCGLEETVKVIIKAMNEKNEFPELKSLMHRSRDRNHREMEMEKKENILRMLIEGGAKITIEDLDWFLDENYKGNSIKMLFKNIKPHEFSPEPYQIKFSDLIEMARKNDYSEETIEMLNEYNDKIEFIVDFRYEYSRYKEYADAYKSLKESNEDYQKYNGKLMEEEKRFYDNIDENLKNLINNINTKNKLSCNDEKIESFILESDKRALIEKLRDNFDNSKSSKDEKFDRAFEMVTLLLKS